MIPIPLLLALIGGTGGALMNRKNPLQGGLTGAGLGLGAGMVPGAAALAGNALGLGSAGAGAAAGAGALAGEAGGLGSIMGGSIGAGSGAMGTGAGLPIAGAVGQAGAAAPAAMGGAGMSKMLPLLMAMNKGGNAMQQPPAQTNVSPAEPSNVSPPPLMGAGRSAQPQQQLPLLLSQLLNRQNRR